MEAGLNRLSHNPLPASKCSKRRAKALAYIASKALIIKELFAYLPSAIECSAGFQPCRSRLRDSL